MKCKLPLSFSKITQAPKAARLLPFLISPKSLGLSSQNTLAYLCNPLFFKHICFSLTSGANPLSRKEKTCFYYLTTMFLSNIVGTSGKKWVKVGVGNVSGSGTT
jgi:hypothetical protein